MIERWDQVRLAIAIQHTPKRDGDNVYRRLLAELEPHGARPIIDPTGADTATWPTYEECLRSTPQTATHRLVIQDDCEVCPGFIDGIKAAIASRPDQLLSFFISYRPQRGSMIQMEACERGYAWAALDNREWLPTQALVWPMMMIGPMLRYPSRATADDERTAGFLRDRGLYCLQSVPSLVEHVHHSNTTLPSINMPGPHRRARCWMGSTGEYLPARDIDWRRGPR
jgi:hypothetical protein